MREDGVSEQGGGFDYIIIGAGSAGCVLANRLTADPAVRVLLLEAGGRNDNLLIKMPVGSIQVFGNKNASNWGFETTPQAALDGRRLFWPRGKGWGGSSSINGLIYIRGHARDYDQWRQMGLDGWSYRDVLPYFRKAERLESGEDDFHGEDGPLWVSHSKSDNPLYGATIKAARQAGHSYTRDFNGAKQEGFGRYQLTIKDGERCSAADGYLRPIVGARGNLEVRSGVHVTRIVIEKGRATGVEYVTRRGGEVTRVHADREVLLSAGAVQSPQILMLSGVGNPAVLSRYGVDVNAALPEVGQNLQDHLDATIINAITQPITFYARQKGLTRYANAMNYVFRRQGPFRENGLEVGGFLKSRSGLDRPDLQFQFVLGVMIAHGNERIEQDGVTMHVCQLRPESRGTISLSSADPFADPLIDPNYLAAETDRRAMRDGLKMAREILAQSALEPYRGEELRPGAGAASDTEIDAYIRRTAETIYHPVGTCRMGADADAVVDGALRLRGVDGLRVVDASVMPTLVGGNTNAPTIMIAEKAADMILGRSPLAPMDVAIAEDLETA